MNKSEDSNTYNTTVVFADVAGSSKLYKTIGDDEANRRINEVIQKICVLVQQHNGIVVKTIGDEVMCHFPQADSAYTATIAMQQEIGEKLLPLRIGMAWGNVIEKSVLKEELDIFGEAVNDAAAVGKISRARQIITAHEFRQQLKSDNAQNLSQFDEVKLKGGQASTKLYRIEWETGSATQSIAKQTVIMAAVGAIQNELIISFHTEDGRTDSLTLTPNSNIPLHIGRDEIQCQLPILSPTASRDHCHIDYQYGKFVLIDHSTNGTYVKNAAGQAVYLRREETPLLGTGEINLGELSDDKSPFVIHFSS